MPKGIGSSSIKAAPGNIFAVRGRLYIPITVKIPAKKFKLNPRTGHPFKQFQQINTYPRSASDGGKGVYAYFHVHKYTGFSEKIPVSSKKCEQRQNWLVLLLFLQFLGLLPAKHAFFWKFADKVLVTQNIA
jgi:hypothetical protein